MSAFGVVVDISIAIIDLAFYDQDLSSLLSIPLLADILWFLSASNAYSLYDRMRKHQKAANDV